MTTLPQRSRRYGVGKEIAGKAYLHRRYEDVLGKPIEDAKRHLPEDFAYDVVKLDKRTGTVSFIQSPDFDTADEPTVGTLITVKPDGSVTRRGQLADPQIYHHKWLFVADDYDGFDIEASKERSRQWTALDGIDRSCIGRRSYWEQHVVPRLESNTA